LITPRGLVIDSKGNLFVLELTGVIKKVSPQGVVSNFVGTSGQYRIDSYDYIFGAGDGKGATARFFKPLCITIDQNDTLYVGEGRQVPTIRKITPDSNVTTVAGSYLYPVVYRDGDPKQAVFGVINGITVSKDRKLYLTTEYLAVEGGAYISIRKIDLSAGNIVSTLNMLCYSDKINNILLKILHCNSYSLLLSPKTCILLSNILVLKSFKLSLLKIFNIPSKFLP
jgi:hypothetical protein